MFFDLSTLLKDSDAKVDASIQVDLPLWTNHTPIKLERKKKLKLKPRIKYNYIDFIPLVDTSISRVMTLNESSQVVMPSSNRENTQPASQASSNSEPRQNLKCKRSLVRIGLSKRQRIKASLHSNFLNLTKKL